MEQKKFLFEKEKVSRALFKMAIPTIVSQLIILKSNSLDEKGIHPLDSALLLNDTVAFFLREHRERNCQHNKNRIDFIDHHKHNQNGGRHDRNQ